MGQYVMDLKKVLLTIISWTGQQHWEQNPWTVQWSLNLCPYLRSRDQQRKRYIEGNKNKTLNWTKHMVYIVGQKLTANRGTLVFFIPGNAASYTEQSFIPVKQPTTNYCHGHESTKPSREAKPVKAIDRIPQELIYHCALGSQIWNQQEILSISTS